jgi:hypothetical protein
MSFQVKKSKDGDWDVFHLSGAMTEAATTALGDLAGQAGAKCRFNLRDVVLLNSKGLYSWLMFMRSLGEQRTIEFVECSPVVVMQLNMLPSFRAHATVRSLYVAYSCGTCGGSKNVLLQIDGQKASPQLGPQACDRCGDVAQPAEMDDPLDFLRKAAS